MPVLLSIHPRHAEAILSGEKTFELRRVPPRKATNGHSLLLLYATAPVKKLVGSCVVEDLLSEEKTILWEKVESGAGVSAQEYDAYFAGREKAHALRVGAAQRLKDPIDPRAVWPSFLPPQSFRYLSSEDCQEIGIPVT
jgi:predicted transcriptional regulator